MVVCNGGVGPVGARGHASLVETDDVVGTDCADFGNRGGVRIRSGLDDGTPQGTPDDGELQDGEVDQRMVVCHGATGPTGADGQAGGTGAQGAEGFNAIVSATPVTGSACADFGNRGGVLIESGLDDGPVNGELDPGEVEASEVICNGQTGPKGDQGARGFNVLVDVDTTVEGN